MCPLRARGQPHTWGMSSPSVFSFIAAHKARTGVSDAEIARRIGITPQNRGLWRREGLRRLPQREHLEGVAALNDTTTYDEVLEAAMYETGYRDDDRTLVIPRSSARFVLRSTVEQSAARAKLRNDRYFATRAVIDGPTSVVLAWLWRRQPDWAVAFLTDYRRLLNHNHNLNDGGNPETITLDEMLDRMRIDLGGLLTSREVEDFQQHAIGRQDITTGL